MRTFLILLLLLLPVYSYSAVIEYNASYLWTIAEVNIPVKNLRLIILDTRNNNICEPFGSFSVANNITLKNFAIVGQRISTGVVIKMVTADTLQEIKTKAKQYAQTHNINLTWKKHQAGNKISDWWNKAVY